MAMPLLILSLTGSVAQMGFVVGLSTAAQLVGSLLGGSIVDKVDRRRLAVWCDAIRWVFTGLIPVVWWLVPAQTWSAIGIWLIYGVVLIGALVFSVYEVAFRAVLPAVVGREHLTVANGRLATSTELAYGVGPAVAGVVIAAIGEPAAIGVNALSFLLAALAWAMLRGPIRAPVEVTVPRGQTAGLRFLWRDPMLRSLTVFESVNALLFAGASTLFIYHIRTDLGETSATIGILLTCGSVGAVAAALVAVRARRRLGLGRATLIGGAVQGAALLATPLAGAAAPLAFLVVLFGFGQILVVILATTYRQERTADALLGRVSAIVLTVTLAMRAIGGVASTSLAAAISATTAFVVLGVLALLTVVGGCLSALARKSPPVDQGSAP
ncbi:MFS transporter [Actinophytocola sediminis]